MDSNDEPTQFSAIEAHKENIIPLPGGRSARSLAAALSEDQYPETTNPSHIAAREVFESELKSAAELDDPLEVYLRYIKWVTETYPSGSRSLHQTLLYKATHNFEDTAHYRNDPRYLRLWITWIAQYADDKREMFVFLARKGVGRELALFYEEFAGWLEVNGRKQQAEEIYEMGIQRQARPLERLERKYGEFVARLAANPPGVDEPSSPALPVVRAALGAKFAPTETVDPQAPMAGFGAEGVAKKKAKLQIFSDASSSAPAIPEGSGRDGKGWDSIASLAERKKENVQQARPWAGETLRQEGGVKAPREKLQIFRDNSSRSQTAQSSSSKSEAANGKVKRPERVFVALELVYPNSENTEEEEYCFEELRAKSRGLFNVDWNEARLEKEARDVRRQRLENDRAREVREDEMMMGSIGTAKIAPPEPKEEEEHSGPVVVESRTVVVALTSSPKGKVKRKSRHNNTTQYNPSQEPTMTFHTKAANDEIYSIFNQPLNLKNEFAKPNSSESESSDEEDEDEETDGEDTIHSRASVASHTETTSDDKTDMLKGAFRDEDESMGFSSIDLSKVKLSQREDDDIDEGEIDEDEEFEAIVPLRHEDADEDTGALNHGSRYRQLPFMTPITEQTESVPPSSMRRKSFTTPSRKRHNEDEDGDDDDDDDEEEEGELEEDEKLIEFGGDPVVPALGHIVSLQLHKRDENVPIAVFKDAENDENAPIVVHTQQPMVVEDKENITVEKLEALKLDEQPPTTAEESLLDFEEVSIPTATKPNLRTTSMSTTTTTATKGPIIQDAQCNPMDPLLRESVWPKLSPPLSSFEGYHDNSKLKSAKTEAIKKYMKAIMRTGDKTTANMPAQPVLTLNDDCSYTIRRELGKGAFAPVYLIENNFIDEDDDEPAQQDTAGRNHLEALKMESPPTPWEFYITRTAHRRLGVNRATESIVRAHEFHLYRDEAFFILDYHTQGTLLDLVNLTATPNTSLHTPSGTFEEVLVIFLTIELLRTVEGMHSKDLLHGDLKADNCLLRLQSTSDGEWSARYNRNGLDGWDKKGLVLIDLGRGIDMRLFRKDVSFIADWKTDAQDCPEMREMRPWTYQVDYYGIACVVHSMLLGKYIETMSVNEGMGAAGRRYKLTMGFKRYWQQEIWGELFDVLLNPGRFITGEGNMGPTGKLKECREKMEGWLETNCERGVGLKGMLRKIEEGVRRKR